LKRKQEEKRKLAHRRRKLAHRRKQLARGAQKHLERPVSSAEDAPGAIGLARGAIA
jgi:hypothetical protein